MLEWFWFYTLVLIGVIAFFFGSDEFDDFERPPILTIVGFASLCAALCVSWPVLGVPVHSWIEGALPQQGTSINEWTATVAFALLCIVFVVATVALSHLTGLAVSRRRAASPRELTAGPG